MSNVTASVGAVLKQRIAGVQSWLLEQQLPNGSWNNSAWHTADVIISLIDTGIVQTQHQDKFDAAYKWLIEHSIEEETDKKSGRLISWEGWTWDTALAIRALKRLNNTGCDTSYPPEHCVVGFTGETGGVNAPRSQRSIEGKT